MDLALLFNEYARDLRRFVTSRVVCQATAADLTQEVFFRLARMPDLGAIENIRTYMFRIATNLVTDHLRARIRRQEPSSPDPETVLPDLPDSGCTPESALSAKQELAVILTALGELSPTCRQIFTLNRFDGLSHRQIADQLGLCVSTVEKNIARALNHCRRRLNESDE